jgi:gamma-glutamyl:cysteine ligase YbdK (ATP-grasp superfamily)
MVLSKKRQRKPLKGLTSGFEVELFLIDSEGNMINSSDSLLKKLRKSTKEHHALSEDDAKKEIGKNMIELGCKPNVSLLKTMKDMLEHLEVVNERAADMGIKLLPLGTYPGKFEPEMRTEGLYGLKRDLFGEERFKITGRCCGFHFHFALPWGVFNKDTKELKELTGSKNKQSVVNSYNMVIAIDPAITAFTQSSPFYQGNYMAKDSRVVVYRGGSVLNYTAGLYSGFQEFGALPHYKNRGMDLMHLIHYQHDLWKSLVRMVRRNLNIFSQYRSKLDVAWNPIKINPHGTIEVRGMDMTYPSVVLATGILLKYALKAIHEEFYQVKASPLAVTEPFKVEKGVINIPPDNYVRQKLQYFSAYEGLENDEVHNYCRRLLKFVKPFVPKNELPLLMPLEKIIKTRITLSDHIINEAKKLGMKDKKDLPNALGAKLALIYSDKLAQDIAFTKKALEKALSKEKK